VGGPLFPFTNVLSSKCFRRRLVHFFFPNSVAFLPPVSVLFVLWQWGLPGLMSFVYTRFSLYLSPHFPNIPLCRTVVSLLRDSSDVLNSPSNDQVFTTQLAFEVLCPESLPPLLRRPFFFLCGDYFRALTRLIFVFLYWDRGGSPLTLFWCFPLFIDFFSS